MTTQASWNPYRPLTDEQMLQFMGRENLKDYDADFLCMLETSEAAVKLKSSLVGEQMINPVEIATLLGWTRMLDHTDIPQLNATASACFLTTTVDGVTFSTLAFQGARRDTPKRAST